jgi:hypothetical protein
MPDVPTMSLELASDVRHHTLHERRHLAVRRRDDRPITDLGGSAWHVSECE